jgi:predicted CDP-diglyceride synthetase/phosphatidate cytidylyltransferase
VILFGIVGALSLASIDSVPEDLVDNAAVLGALCLLTALVFIGDLLMSPIRGKRNKQDEARILEKDPGKMIRISRKSLVASCSSSFTALVRPDRGWQSLFTRS